MQPTKTKMQPYAGRKVVPTVTENSVMGNPMAYKTPDAELQAPIPKRIQLLLDNSADSVNTKSFVIFDALGFVESITGAKDDPTTQDMISYALLKKFLENAKMVIGSMRVKATSSSNQFMNVMKVIVGGIDGNSNTENIHLEDAVSGSQYDQKIQVYNTEIVVGPRHGLTYTVNAGEKVYLTFNISNIYSL